MDHDDTLTPDNTRRDFLRKTAIGAAVAGGAWVAPTVLSLDAARAAGTCVNGSFVFPWTLGGEGVRHVGPVNSASAFIGNVGLAAGLDVRIINTASTGVSSTGLVGDNWMTRGPTAAAGCPPTVNCGSAATTNFPRGGQSSFYSLLMHGAGNTGNNGLCNTCNANGTTSRTTEVTFGFFNPGTQTAHGVTSLAFSLYDIDASTGNYRDQVEIFINGSATAATLGIGNDVTASIPAAVPTVAVAAGGRANFQAISGRSAAANSADGNVNLQFNSTNAITTVRVKFTDILGSAPQTVQWVGIGNLTFCKV